MADAPHLRAATSSDIPSLAEACISAANFSIPGRNLGDELYDLERDIAPGEAGVSSPGKLWTQFQQQFAEGHIWLVEVNGGVVGAIAWYEPIWGEAEYKPGEISSLFVRPSFHGQGIGTLLLNHAKQQVAAALRNPNDEGREVLMEVRCFEKNPRALKFYERGGFVRDPGVKELNEMTQEYLALLLWFK
ncbi:acyl-CoA N-acyltransferase [Mycena latifolia]|nr:acyl-CoA N-acyltransferase [Mycena latifolia]